MLDVLIYNEVSSYDLPIQKLNIDDKLNLRISLEQVNILFF